MEAAHTHAVIAWLPAPLGDWRCWQPLACNPPPWQPVPACLHPRRLNLEMAAETRGNSAQGASASTWGPSSSLPGKRKPPPLPAPRRCPSGQMPPFARRKDARLYQRQTVYLSRQ
ncbi:hypothetical protein NDU88_001724 [Pleurodeles waltl]|uniref:Uncharacterized protein n=1 Tax=Pleurodeles waltl TaxID=8319 RepID=A0AAV7QAP5_PLEWA|nr:hypothetical protein NDU88_001724 [Pleurodeles waltl]